MQNGLERECRAASSQHHLHSLRISFFPWLPLASTETAGFPGRVLEGSQHQGRVVWSFEVGRAEDNQRRHGVREMVKSILFLVLKKIKQNVS